MDGGDVSQFDDQNEMREKFTKVFKTRTQEEWTKIFSNLDACVQPIINWQNAASHPHNMQLATFLENTATGKAEPAPAPKLSRTPGVEKVRPEPKNGADTIQVLTEAAFSQAEIEQLLQSGVVENRNSKSKL